jgi:hypothetical protein
MQSPGKCAHPSCECLVQPNGPYGKYCSEPCKKARQITELHCNCQHEACREPGRAAQGLRPDAI